MDLGDRVGCFVGLVLRWTLTVEESPCETTTGITGFLCFSALLGFKLTEGTSV